MDRIPEYLYDKNILLRPMFISGQLVLANETPFPKHRTVIYNKSFNTLSNRLMKSKEEIIKDESSKNLLVRHLKEKLFLRYN